VTFLADTFSDLINPSHYANVKKRVGEADTEEEDK